MSMPSPAISDELVEDRSAEVVPEDSRSSCAPAKRAPCRRVSSPSYVRTATSEGSCGSRVTRVSSHGVSLESFSSFLFLSSPPAAPFSSSASSP